MKVDLNIYGQEGNQTTWRLAKMNLAIRGIAFGSLFSVLAATLPHLRICERTPKENCAVGTICIECPPIHCK